MLHFEDSVNEIIPIFGQRLDVTDAEAAVARIPPTPDSPLSQSHLKLCKNQKLLDEE